MNVLCTVKPLSPAAPDYSPLVVQHQSASPHQDYPLLSSLFPVILVQHTMVTKMVEVVTTRLCGWIEVKKSEVLHSLSAADEYFRK